MPASLEEVVVCSSGAVFVGIFVLEFIRPSLFCSVRTESFASADAEDRLTFLKMSAFAFLGKGSPL